MTKQNKFEVLLSSSPLFSNLPKSKLRAFAEISTKMDLAKGEALLREGERGDELFVVITGHFEVLIRDGLEDKKIGEVKVGALLGEGQLVTGGERSATVRATEPSTVLVMMREPWLKCCEHTDLPLHLASMARERFGKMHLRTHLKTRFPSGNDDVIDKLLEISTWLFLSDREYVLEEGDLSTHFYFLLQGRLAVMVGGKKVGAIQPGGSFGESSIAGSGQANATLVSVRPSLVAQLASEDFLEVAKQHPTLLLDIIAMMHQRATQGHSKKKNTSEKNIIAFIPISDNLDPAMVEAMVTKAFEAHSSVKILTEDAVVAHFGDPKILDVREKTVQALGVQLYLEALENEFEHVVLVASGRSPNWALRSCLNANQLVYLAASTGSGEVKPNEKRLEARLTGIAPEKMLVILRPGSERPSKTERWLKGRQVDHVLQVAQGSSDDYERVGRYLTKNAVGLCLSGGGAIAFGGIGMISAMLELGIPIDAVGGASAGAMIGALYCATKDYEKMLDMMKSLMFWQTAYGMFDNTNPQILAMTKGRYYRKAIRKVFGDIGIEDMPLPLLLLSANVTSARQCVGVRGPFVEHFYATNAYPPFLPPAVIDGDLHVDGGLMNNVPVAELKELVKGGPVVAMDVTPLKTFQELKPTPEGLTGVEVLISRFKPGTEKSKRWPTKGELTSRLKMVNHVVQMDTRKAAADIYMQPDMTKFNLWDHFKYKKIGHHCHEQVVNELGEWWTTHNTA